MELKSNFSSAMEKSVENVMNGEDYKIRNEEEFVAEFVETLVYTVDAKSGIQIDILQCDKEKGIALLKADEIEDFADKVFQK